ncbi:hypothetical protein [Streptomyces sp. NPDC059010]|uniref:hypothetical protein n=1 Tax=Streptomyces sp. NPDC059010 TaxID=3346695 RepID=UPI0036AFCF02
MPHTAPGHRLFRQTAGAIGAVALISLGATPAVAADTAPGLVLGEMAPFEGVKPGSTFEVPATFTNTGTEALDKVWLSYTVSHGLNHTDLPSNCTAWKIWGFDEIPVSTQAVCKFDQTVKPGVVYAAESDMRVDALDSALYDTVRVAVTANDNAPGDEASSGPVQGTGPALKLVERPDATPAAPGSAEHEDWDAQTVKVTAANTADFLVTGDRLKGRVGDTVDLKLKFTNAGPGWVYNGTVGIPLTHVLIKMPAGTSVTKGNGYCDKQSSGTYECGISQAWVNEGEGETYTFKLKIDKAVQGAKGSVALEAKSRPFDDNKANDKADITLDVTGGGSTGGSGSTGSTGGSGSTGGAGTTGGSGSTGDSSGGGSATGGTSTTGDSTTGSTGSTTVSGDLASTGSGSTLPVAGAAAAAVGIGTGAVLLVRRRRAAHR